MSERIEAPTKAQIAAMTDPAVVKRWIEDIEGVVTTIETRLSYSGINDDDWRERAQGALIWHRRALKQLNRRAHELRLEAKFPTRPGAYKTKAKTKVENLRPAEDNDPLTNEALASVHALDLAALVTIAQADTELAWLDARITAVERDRNDEIAQPSQRRDEGFLAATKSTLSTLKKAQTAVLIQRRRLTKDERAADDAAKLAREDRLERRFIDAARDLLPAATFQALWDRVDRQEIEASGTEIAA